MTMYLLTGNPTKPETEGGMRRAYFDRAAEEFHRTGSVIQHWTFYNSQSRPSDQVVLYRAGPRARKADLVGPGIIAFGHRITGDSEQGHYNGRQEYPVRLANLRWGNTAQPFICRSAMKQNGIWPSNNFQASGTLADGDLIKALDAYCRRQLGASLSELCTKRIP